jgi:NAD(P)-dependent dehydrogenase (short-subunit alcohol dehydrogenase family)
MVLDDFHLNGKVALVTGGSQGLGLAMARALAEAGASVAIAARRADRLEQARTTLQINGNDPLVLNADLADVETPERIVAETLAHYGHLDILITAAGTQLRKPILQVTPDDWERVMAVNLRAVYFTCQHAARAMCAQGSGKIINIASLTSVGAWHNVSIYGTSKGGIVQMTKAMALEWAPYHINVNAIGPGTFPTELTEPLYNDANRTAAILQRIPMGRAGTPGDLAGATVFLASKASDYITGQVLYVDGGWLVT